MRLPSCELMVTGNGGLPGGVLFLLHLPLLAAAAQAAKQPHLFAVLADDLGFYDTAIYNPTSPTPNLAALAKEGIRLDHNYVFRYCSPTRRSLLTGRFPNHITSVQPDGSNLCSDFLPLACAILPEKLKEVGYVSHFVGKGHLGYETTDHLPINRGFSSHVGYLGGGESYFFGCAGNGCGTWEQPPANASQGQRDMWHDYHAGDDIADQIFYSANFYTERAVSIIDAHPSEKPLFMYLPYQNVHAPNQAPPDWELNNYSSFGAGNTYANMLHMLDSGCANVTAALRKRSFWGDSLLLFTADNGGIGGVGNNHPLRGHKHDPWEGGTRATAFIVGGLIPPALQGTTTGAKLVIIADWYVTFLKLAGADPVDDVFFADGEGGGATHGVDGVDVWPLLMGSNLTQPRSLTPTTEVSIVDASSSSQWWKLILLAGQSNYYKPNNTRVDGADTCLAARQPDPPMPGRTDALVNGCPVCNATQPCLYDLLQDPRETKNLATAHPDVVTRLAAALSVYQPYITGHLAVEILEANYTKIEAGHWGNFRGPCYYRKGTPLPPPGPPAPPPPPPKPKPPPSPPAKPCLSCGTLLNGVHFPGHDIGHAHNVGSSSECCDKCKAQAGCAGYCYGTASKACTLKSQLLGKGSKASDFVSGRCDHATPDPEPGTMTGVSSSTVASALPAADRSVSVTELVGMAPASGSTASGPSTIKWAQLQYETSATSVDEVSLELLNASSPQCATLGSFFHLDLAVGGGGGAALAAKIVGSKLYSYIEEVAPVGAINGCCADTLRIYDRAVGGHPTEWDLDVVLNSIFPETSTFHHATHTFDVEEEGGTVFAYLMVQYSSNSSGMRIDVGASLVNAVVSIDTTTGAVRKTADGDLYFSFAQKLGTLSTDPSDSVYNVQYYTPPADMASDQRPRRRAEEGQGAVEQWHGNGMLRFQSKSGVKLLAFTHRFDAEAILLKDPYAYTSAQGGGTILQRFGTPASGDVAAATTHHAFGVPSGTPVWTGGVHNLFYTASSPSTALRGAETLSLFVNSVEGGNTSFAFEFAIKLTPQTRGVVATDAVFATQSVHAACGFQALAQGGARIIADGVFIVADGLSFTPGGMLQIIDTKGGQKSLKYPYNATGFNVVKLYDPFLRVVTN